MIDAASSQNPALVHIHFVFVYVGLKRVIFVVFSAFLAVFDNFGAKKVIFDPFGEGCWGSRVVWRRGRRTM